MIETLIYKIHTSLFTNIVKAFANGCKDIDKDAKQIKPFASYSGYSFTLKDIELLESWELESFIVANIGSIEVNSLLKELGKKYIKEASKSKELKKKFYKEYVREAQEIIARYIPELVSKLPPGGWIATNLRDGIATAYHGARFNKVQEYRNIYVALQKHTKGDNKVRESHAKIDKVIFMLSDPLAAKVVSPLDYNCRCDDEYLTEAEYNRRVNGTMADNQGILVIPAKRTPAQEKALLKTWAINPDFARNAVQDKSIYKWVKRKFKTLSTTEQKFIERKIREYRTAKKSILPESFLKPLYLNRIVAGGNKFYKNQKYLKEILVKEIV